MKIIISDECRKNMEKHRPLFLTDWEKAVREAEQMLSSKETNRVFFTETVDMKETIGYDRIVTLKAHHKVFYAKIRHCDVYTKFAEKCVPDTTKKLSMVLIRSEEVEGAFNLLTTYPATGGAVEPEMASKKELQESLEFWKDHAWVYTGGTIDKSSIKKSCPYNDLYLKMAQK